MWIPTLKGVLCIKGLLFLLTQVRADISDLGDRINHVESNMGKFASPYNELVDVHKDTEEEIQNLKLKVNDLKIFLEKNI